MADTRLGYVAVSTHFEGVGSVHGIFDSKDEAQAWIDKKEFPQPDRVFVRPLWEEK